MNSINDSTRSLQVASAGDNKPHQKHYNDDVTPLLQLPAELRNQIYEFVLCGHEIKIGSNRRSWGWEGPFCARPVSFTSPNGNRVDANDVLPLLSVCHQIRDEIGLLHISRNTFVFAFADYFEKWATQKLSLDQRKAITVVRCPLEEAYLDMGPLVYGRVLVSFDVFPGLQRLTLLVPDPLPANVQTELIVEFKKASGKPNLKVGFELCPKPLESPPENFSCVILPSQQHSRAVRAISRNAQVMASSNQSSNQA